MEGLRICFVRIRGDLLEIGTELLDYRWQWTRPESSGGTGSPERGRFIY